MLTGLVVLAIQSSPAAASVLQTLGELTQALVVVGFVAGVLFLFFGLLEPVKRENFLKSTSARLTSAAGGTKATPQQA
jgi:NADH-quinone oxidoreductase subunit H